ncbi:arginine--tRNA ligase [Aerococcaceae bacterium DSM 111020]|nr:arginine--tRNA ligase [Aerococcaceae bacterium DSM 111020]
MNNKDTFITDLAVILKEHLTEEQIESVIEIPKDSSMGDLAFPAFQLAKVMRKAPHLIANDIAASLSSNHYAQIEAVGPYVNVKLIRSEASTQIIKHIFEAQNHYGENNLGQDGNMIIDMSSPNIAKPMSMGHLRSTVIGNAIANLASKSHYNPIKINYLGDWGTQFGKLIVAYQLWGDPKVVEQNPVTELVRLYVHFHEVAIEQPELEEQARQVFLRLEQGDEELLSLWKWFREESLKEFQRIYELLDVSFDSYNGEAFFNDKMDPVIEELNEKGLTEESEGATIVDLDEYDLPPALIKKSDGATLYVTRDLAAAKYRYEKYDFDKAIYVVGNEQRVHFQQLKAVLGKMGYDWAQDIIHVPFGLITKDGKKLSTRKGDVVLLEDVLNEAIELALEQIEAKNPDLKDKEQVARQVGVGAVIFHDLKNERINSFDFNLDEIVRFEGETGPYVQYSYARAMRVLRLADMDVTSFDYQLQDDYSWEIIKKLSQYGSTIERAMREYEPSVIAKYVLQLSQLFNKFYANVRILEKDDQLPARLALVKATSIVIKDALALLGVHAPHEM